MKLENFEKEDFLKAPEGYFETLPKRIQQRITAENASKGKTVTFLPRAAKWGMAAAAAVAMLWVATALFRSVPEPDSQAVELAIMEEVSKQEIYQYLLMEGVADEEIAELAGNELTMGTPELELTPELMEEVMDLEELDLEEYL